MSFFLAFFSTMILDQFTKWWARGAGSVIYNKGISFGIGLSDSPLFFCVLTLTTLGCIFFLFKDVWMKNTAVFGALCGAALSNVSDRFFFAGVQDFLPLPLGVKNNLADWIIFLCLTWICGQMFLQGVRVKSITPQE